jgi:predicted nucleic-acid-binding protein
LQQEKKQEKLNNFINYIKKNYKTILWILAGYVFVYLVILLATPKPKIPSDLKATIDSLTQANKILVSKQKSIDSTINSYEIKISQVDFQLDNIKEKTTIVREYYHEVNKQAGNYTPTQIDSFFKSRYNY